MPSCVAPGSNRADAVSSLGSGGLFNLKDLMYYIIIFLSLPRFPFAKMSASKRRTLTTDDLLRRQEEPHKRRKQSPVARRDEGEHSSLDEDDDFDLTSSEDGEVEKDGSERESEVEENADSETREETSLVGTGRLGYSSESSSLLGSRVTMKPRLIHRHTLSPEAGPSKQVTFSSLGISPPLLSAMSKMAIHTPTEIQRACIPPLLAGPLVVARGTRSSLTMTIL